MDTTGRKTITVGTYISSSPEHISNWNFASEEWHCPSAKNDLKREGKFKWRMEARDGSGGFDYSGVYEKVIPNEKIIKRLDDGRLIVIDFKKLDRGTKITETFEAEKENSLDSQRKGWQAILDNFKSYVMSQNL
jgi:uncharacterized protein YndB with AHSA1/START domain